MQQPDIAPAGIEALPFTDLYVRLDDGRVPARYRPDPIRSRETGNLKVPAEYEADVAEIRRRLQVEGPDEGTLTYKGKRLRYARFEAAEQERWAALRAVPLDLPVLDELRLHPDFVRMARGWGKKRGLIVLGGRTGDGKTTTCVALLKHFLENEGGTAYTCEDPVEFQVQGAISERGFCLQYEVRDDEDWNPAIKRAMRTRPDYIFIGEIRTAEAAEQLLKAATSGHLVITTVHGGDVPDAVSAILQLAEYKMGAVARQIMADRLVAAVHQKLTPQGPRIECLVRGGANDPSGNVIRSGELGALQKSVLAFPPAGAAARGRPGPAPSARP